MPVKFSLKFVVAICSNRIDAKRVPGNDVIDEMNGILLGLGVPGVNL
jgi:hypothetical protein